jgi:hypothetical protein
MTALVVALVGLLLLHFYSGYRIDVLREDLNDLKLEVNGAATKEDVFVDGCSMIRPNDRNIEKRIEQLERQLERATRRRPI